MFFQRNNFSNWTKDRSLCMCVRACQRVFEWGWSMKLNQKKTGRVLSRISKYSLQGTDNLSPTRPFKKLTQTHCDLGRPELQLNPVLIRTAAPVSLGWKFCSLKHNVNPAREWPLKWLTAAAHHMGLCGAFRTAGAIHCGQGMGNRGRKGRLLKGRQVWMHRSFCSLDA